MKKSRKLTVTRVAGSILAAVFVFLQIFAILPPIIPAQAATPNIGGNLYLVDPVTNLHIDAGPGVIADFAAGQVFHVKVALSIGGAEGEEEDPFYNDTTISITLPSFLKIDMQSTS